MPSIVSLPQTQRHQSGFSSDDLAAKELEELKVFRTIHIEGTVEPNSIGTPENSVIDLTILEPRTQIYLRNIMDRYPLLPSHLALRLAKANCARANRLDLTRHNGNVRFISKLVQITGSDRPPSSERRSPTDDVAQFPKPLHRTQNVMNPDVPSLKMDKPRPHTCTTCKRSFVRLQHFKRHERSHTKKKLCMCEQCTQSFTSKDLLLQHLQKLHMTSPPSSYGSGYRLTLNSPTAMNRYIDGVPVTYLTKGRDYAITIHDSMRGLQSIGFFCYRTVFQIYFENEQQRQDPSACWQHWKEGRGLYEDYQDSGELQAVEYLGPEPGLFRGIGDPEVESETASLDRLSIMWSPASYRSTGLCTIFMRFNFLSTDFVHSTSMEDFPVRLYAETEDLSPIASNPISDPTAEICFCKISLLRSQGAAPKRLNDTNGITKTINKKEQHIACMENDNKDLGSASKGVDHRSGKVPEDERTWVVSSQDSNWRSARDLRTELDKTRLVRSSGRPTSVLNVKGGQRDDPNDFPVSIPEESRLRQQSTTRSTCMICSESDHPLEDCPHQQREFPSSRATGFWTARTSKPRSPSIESQSSERNSSLHGAGRLDPEDQNLSLPDSRSRRSSASFSDSSAGFPPPPVYIEKERYPSAGGRIGVLDQVPKPLSFFCDICEQRIEILRRRDWQ